MTPSGRPASSWSSSRVGRGYPVAIRADVFHTFCDRANMQLRFIPVGLLAGTLVLAGCEAAAPTTALLVSQDASLAKGSKINEWIAIDRTVLDPCADESVRIFGKAHVLVKEKMGKDGTVKTTLHLNYAGVQGVGDLSGREYQVVGNSREVAFAHPSGAYESVLKESFQLVSKGRDANYKSYFVAVFRIDENGEVTQEIEERSSCK